MKVNLKEALTPVGLVLFGMLVHWLVFHPPHSNESEYESLIKGKINIAVRNGNHYFEDGTRQINWYYTRPIEVVDCREYGAYRVKNYDQKNEKIDQYPLYSEIVCLNK